MFAQGGDPSQDSETTQKLRQMLEPFKEQFKGKLVLKKKKSHCPY